MILGLLLTALAVAGAAAVVSLSVFVLLVKALRTRWFKRGYRLNLTLRYVVFLVGGFVGYLLGGALGRGGQAIFGEDALIFIFHAVGLLASDLSLVYGSLKADRLSRQELSSRRRGG